MSGPAPAIELKGIDKSFGPVHANKHVSVAVAAGSIHGLVGENGAGKSTLMSILYGFYEADAGEIRVNGETGPHPLPRRRRSHTASAWCINISCWFRHAVACWRTSCSAPRAARFARRGAPKAVRAEAGASSAERICAGRRSRTRIVGELSCRVAAARRDPESAGARGRRSSMLDEPTAVLTPVRGRSVVLDAQGTLKSREQDDRLHHPQAARDHAR